MRTPRRTSRWIAPASRSWRDGPWVIGRRAGRACFLAGLVVVLALWLSGCGGGIGDAPARTTTEATGGRPATSGTEPPRTTATRPPRTTGEPPTTRTPTTSPPASAAAQAPTSTSAASAESGGLGALGWILLGLAAAGLLAALLVWRSRRRSAWDAEAAALETETRTATGTRLPPVLTAETSGQRALSWPPLRAGLVDLVRRWDLLAQRAPDEQRRNRSVQVRSLLQELVAAVDAENEALATGRDWMLLRPRVDQATRALSGVLAGVPLQEPAAAGQPGPVPGQQPPPPAG
jgi:hypothetical protein